MSRLVAVRLRQPTTTWGLLQDCVGLGEGKAADCWSYDTALDTGDGVIEGDDGFEDAAADGTDAIGDKDENSQRGNCCSGERQERLLGATRRVSFKLGHIMENGTERSFKLEIPKSSRGLGVKIVRSIKT